MVAPCSSVPRASAAMWAQCAPGPARFQGQMLGRQCQRLSQMRLDARRPQRQVARMSAVAEPATLELKKFDGTVSGSEQIALKVAGKATANGLVHRYLVTVRQNDRRGTASTKTRAEVRGGGRKPYAQKGSGNARMGSRRSPLLPGGGVSFGPKPKDWSIKMNKKERRLALATALQSASPATVVVEDLSAAFEKPSTKALAQALERWGVGAREYALLIVSDVSDNLKLSSRNVERLEVNTASALRVYDILRADKIIIEASALQFIQEFYGDSDSE